MKKKETSNVSQKFYSKSSLLAAKRYKESRDLVEGLLQEDREYEISEVDQMIENYLKGKVE
ncbi:hypothetical protein [Lachnoclostridium phytofermentans]|uniref:hypothetical protein n=1 Tax=Lachnoclostridium phytofermentans TaxID=66219 RepID=UPI00030FF772|nr:hypothetical protein [Lachnoclostridium phytofermentans]